MNIWRDEQRDAEPSLVRLRSASCLTLANGATCPSRHVASTARSTLRILLRAFDLARDALQRIALALALGCASLARPAWCRTVPGAPPFGILPHPREPRDIPFQA